MATSSTKSNTFLELVGSELYEEFFGDDNEVGRATAGVGLERQAVESELDQLSKASENYEQKLDIAETQQRFAFPKTEKVVGKRSKENATRY